MSAAYGIYLISIHFAPYNQHGVLVPNTDRPLQVLDKSNSMDTHGELHSPVRFHEKLTEMSNFLFHTRARLQVSNTICTLLGLSAAVHARTRRLLPFESSLLALFVCMTCHHDPVV